jgi:hypothetical protein
MTVAARGGERVIDSKRRCFSAGCSGQLLAQAKVAELKNESGRQRDIPRA